MPELPEILTIASQMRESVVGETISDILIAQPKCLNVPPGEYTLVRNKRITGVEGRGKWIVLFLDGGPLLLISLGMGADIQRFPVAEHLPPPDKWQVKVVFASGSGFTMRFWWFGHFHLVDERELGRHAAGQLGPSPLDDAFTSEALEDLLRTSRRRVKDIITDQKRIAGIGNAYVHDILFLAGIHPAIPGRGLDEAAVRRLHSAMREVLNRVLSKRGLAYERDFFGVSGGFEQKDFLVGYHEGQACPQCRTPIEKARIGGQSSYLCPSCQALAP